MRLPSVSCHGLHDKTQVTVKLQNIAHSTAPAKNLGDHTHTSFEFRTSVHNMTFDIVKIDVYDIKPLKRHKIGRAYLPLRDLQKLVGNKYDNDGDDTTEPEQSVLSTLFDTASFCKKHDDTFELNLPLFKHGSYSKFGSNRHHHRHREGQDKGVVVSKGSERGNDVSVVENPRPLAHAASFAQQVMNGVEVGMITVQAILHFKDQTENPLFAQLGKGSKSSVRSTSTRTGSVRRGPSRRTRHNTNRSTDSSQSSDSSILGGNHERGNRSDQHVSGVSNEARDETSGPAPIVIQQGARSKDQHQRQRILRAPSSPPNLSLHYGANGSPESPLSPSPFSPASPTSPLMSPQSLSENHYPWGESEHISTDNYSDGDDAEYEEDACNGSTDDIKGEHLTEADRKHEEELMADIMANGDQAKKEFYLNGAKDGHGKGHHAKNKKAKFNFFSEQTTSAFKDIQMVYSSFFGHGWNLSRSEFWKGFNIVEQYFARHQT